MTKMSVGECIDEWPIHCEYFVSGNIHSNLVAAGHVNRQILGIAAMLQAKIGQKISYEELVDYVWDLLYDGCGYELAEMWVDEVLPFLLQYGLVAVTATDYG